MLMHDGRVGFSIDHDHVFGHEIVVVIAKSLIEYLDDVGLSHHAEIYKDESGRALQDEQQRQGEFQDEHMDEVLERLRGDGLVHALCYGSERNKEKYHERHLLPYPMPCKHCGQTII